MIDSNTFSACLLHESLRLVLHREPTKIPPSRLHYELNNDGPVGCLSKQIHFNRCIIVVEQCFLVLGLLHCENPSYDTQNSRTNSGAMLGKLFLEEICAQLHEISRERAGHPLRHAGGPGNWSA